MKINNLKIKILQATFVAVGLVAFLPVFGVRAWGPDRPTFKMQQPPMEVRFNSITDNPAVGDERNFVRVMEVGAGNKLSDEVKVEAGKTYEVYIYYHNNASANTNKTGVGIADNVRVAADYPDKVEKGKKAKVSAVISAADAKPNKVWDEAYFTTDADEALRLRYVPASAKIFNAGKVNGKVLSEELFSPNGTFIGINVLDGRIPGCGEYSGRVVFHLRAEKVSSEVSKQISLDGKNFSESVKAKPGDTVTYRVNFKNNGNIDLTNVVFNDTLPQGVSLVPGSTFLINQANPKGLKMVDLIGQNGFNTGLYGEGASAILTYKVKLDDDILDKLACGENQLKNIIHVTYNQGKKSDEATLVVERPCKDKPSTPSELPKTGPGEIALALIALACMVTGAAYWYKSKKDLKRMQKQMADGETLASADEPGEEIAQENEAAKGEAQTEKVKQAEDEKETEEQAKEEDLQVKDEAQTENKEAEPDDITRLMFGDEKEEKHITDTESLRNFYKNEELPEAKNADDLHESRENGEHDADYYHQGFEGDEPKHQDEA